MPRTISRNDGFTFAEMMVAATIFSMVAVALMAFTSTSLRLITRNLATNHSHEAARTSAQRMLADLHDSGSPFRLVNFDGASFSDVNPMVTADREPFTQQFLSTRANGVRFRRLVGGPCKIAASTTAFSTELTFEARGYRPQAGDKVMLPLISREFSIVSVTGAPSGPLQRTTVRLSEPLGFTITTSPQNVTTAYFYRRAAYSVLDNTLRYHRNYPSVSAADTAVVRGNITSPKPFALLYRTSTSPWSDGLNLRVSLETYDLPFSGRSFYSGTTTHQSVIPPLNQPPLITN